MTQDVGRAFLVRALLEAFTRTGRTTELKALAVDTLALQLGDPTMAPYLSDHGDVGVPESNR